MWEGGGIREGSSLVVNPVSFFFWNGVGGF